MSKPPPRVIVKDWTPIESAPEGRIVQVVRYAPGAARPPPSLAIRRSRRWV